MFFGTSAVTDVWSCFCVRAFSK